MSQQDNFSTGFLLGTVVGSIVGGAIGALLASGRLNGSPEEPSLIAEQDDGKPTKKRSLKLVSNGKPDMEIARRNLEGKIAQLNEAIDDVRQQLGGINNGSPLSEESGQSISKDR
jgi:hypothetical protein